MALRSEGEAGLTVLKPKRLVGNPASRFTSLHHRVTATNTSG
jgi:hypothetical protein